MHLKSLTLRGFKSFASTTTLHFEPGITCVVGPNGSGKSNVVDALSWVMGEQGAKTLRGGRMEDVVFAGTPSRAPLGRAEVVLTIDNADGALPIDYAEVTIGRTMFRSGGSEYAINGRPSRLLDVQELLSDSGIGQQMHVIVGQGQLDSILQATPEGRRGFIEEAAGVLKHRKRKDKALRKLDACDTNLARLTDLLTEIRRQLKPLGRQAEVARKAAVVQAEVRDAQARLLADDLVQATVVSESDRADVEALTAKRADREAELAAARVAEGAAEESVRLSGPRVAAAQEGWYALAALRERVRGTASLAAERIRTRQSTGEAPLGPDPAEFEREAAAVTEQERALTAEVAGRTDALSAATAALAAAEESARVEAERFAGGLRAAADRREGRARLIGQVAALRSRTEAAGAEIGRLGAAAAEASARAAEAARAFTALETQVVGLDDSELGLDAAHEEATATLEALDARLAEVAQSEAAAARERSGLLARVEALRVGLQRGDAGAALLAAEPAVPGLLGPLSSLVEVEPGYETAIAAALGGLTEAVAVRGTEVALTALAQVKAENAGRAQLLMAGSASPGAGTPTSPADLPLGARWASEVLCCNEEVAAGVRAVLHQTAVADDLAMAVAVVAAVPDAVVATRTGELLTQFVAIGGSATPPSTLELQVAIEEAEARLDETHHTAERLRFAESQLRSKRQQAADGVAATLARLHESDAALAGVAEELGDLGTAARSAQAEAERIRSRVVATEQARAAELTELADWEGRLAGAEEIVDPGELDPGRRDALFERERQARAEELEARLALRTAEERGRALAGRAEGLRRRAVAERRARQEASDRRARRRREAEVAEVVHGVVTELVTQVEVSLGLAEADRVAAEEARRSAEAELATARQTARTLAAEVDSVVTSVHRGEVARAEHRMRLEVLTDRAAADLGLDPEVLMAEYGPEQPVPVLTRDDGTALTAEDGPPEPVPYDREHQTKRLRVAERSLAVLGRVNPLALEEFAAAEERAQFLAHQLEDLRQTRADLVNLIAQVDARVEHVFAEAYADVEQAFGRVFARLFPGGEGRLVLTEPGNPLTTGVEVEARPPGKKIKRLSLLSGGERSLVAVAFLVSLFLARPSPFYILDEVEAALDEVNLGRLLEIYTELRDSSQLLVITHQKRTMEIADALYGVTMRGDGVSTVISQRLRESASVA